MILLCGIPSEPSLGLVIDAVRELGVPYLVFHQREFQSAALELQIDSGGVRGWMQYQGNVYRLEDFTAVYTRLMDYRFLPEIEAEPQDSPNRLHCAAVHDTLMRWHEIMPGRVLSRGSEVSVNYSKPFQAQLIHNQGFKVPETLITNDPDLVRAFCLKKGRVVYKSISYIRSIVKTFEDTDLDRIWSVRTCPTQFQQYVDGTNVRVHTVGTKAFATAITAQTTDYRYAYLEGEEERLREMQLPEDLARRCVALSQALNLGFAGIDLKIVHGGEVYCLEVNPCPAFSYYQLHTGQPIAAAVARYLAGMA
jgi:hypothetical protein